MISSVSRGLVFAGLLALVSVQGSARKKSALDGATQIVVVTTSDWNAVAGTLQRFQRSKQNKKWLPVGDPVQIVVGKNGLGWGAGIFPSGSLEIHGSPDPSKKEGDSRAPAGVFLLSRVFGYASAPEAGWRMPYVGLTPEVECVDDTNSKFYNRVLTREGVSPDWNSSEHMLRSDELYRWGIIVDHNSSPPQPGRGSCIFMHIWRGPGQGTVGCTAMPREQLESILAWLDPEKRPLLIQLPMAQYQLLMKQWNLPPLSVSASH
jgi:D-alanyl-D-alanine dipeptidase